MNKNLIGIIGGFIALITSSNLNAQTLSAASANGLLTESSGVYNLTWYSNRSTPFEKSVTIDFSGYSSGDKITVTGDQADTANYQVKSNISGSTAYLDVTRWSGNSRNLCFDPGTASGSVVLTFQRMGAGGSGTFTNTIDVEVANSSCIIQTGTGKKITLKCTVIVDPNIYNYVSQATLSNWNDAASWSPSRTSPGTSDILVFDQGSTALDVNVNVTNQTIKSIILQPNSNVRFREEGSNGTITLSGGEFKTHETSTLKTNGYDTLRFALTNGTDADISGDLICETPTISGDQARLVFTGDGDVYYGGDVDVQSRNSLYMTSTASNTVFFDGESQEFKGSGTAYFGGLANVTVGVAGKTGTPNSTLTLKRSLPILAVLTLRDYATIANTTVPASSSAADWQSWVPDLQIRNNGTNRGRVATLGTNASITGSSYFEMYSNGIRTYRTIAFPMKTVHLSQITDDLIVSGVFSGSNADSMDRSCGYCKASSYRWDETNSTWDSINASSTPTKFEPGDGLLLFFRGLAGNGLGNPSASANAGNIDFKGILHTGSKTATLNLAGTGNLAGFNLVGNPFPCHIDWRALSRTNVADKFQYYDPTTKSYNVYNNTSGSLTLTGTTKFTTGNVPYIIEIGASFFATATSNNGTITFDEADKITTEPNATAFRMEPTPLKCNQLQTEVKYLEDSIKYSDMFHLEWNSEQNDVKSELDIYDAAKIFGGYLGIGTMSSNGEWLTQDFRPATGNASQVIPVNFQNFEQTKYVVTAKTCDNNSEYSVRILDKQLDSIIEVGSETQYVFSTSSNDQYKKDRFSVLVDEKSNSTEKLVALSTTVYPNPSEDGNIKIAHNSSVKVLGIEIMNLNGQVVQKANDVRSIHFNAHLTNATYIVKIITNKGVDTHKVMLNR
jgi:hypothetical protein